MNTSPLHKTSTLLLLLSCSFAVSCSTEPTILDEKPKLQRSSEIPKPLDDVVVASEEEVLTWDESAGQSNAASEIENSGK